MELGRHTAKRGLAGSTLGLGGIGSSSGQECWDLPSSSSSFLSTVLEEELGGGSLTHIDLPLPHGPHTFPAWQLYTCRFPTLSLWFCLCPPLSKIKDRGGLCVGLPLNGIFVSLACQAGSQSLWPVPCSMSTSTRSGRSHVNNHVSCFS